MCRYKVNGIDTHSGSLVFTSRCKAEIEINGIFYKLIFVENGGDIDMSADLTDGKHHLIFKNLFRARSTSTGVNIPLENGGITKIDFSIHITGSGPVRSILFNYSYRNEQIQNKP